MSEYYVKDNTENARNTFNKKAFYKIDTANEFYTNLVDFNFAEKQLYGRVDRNFVPMVVRNYVLQLKRVIEVDDPKEDVRALNFVADAFNNLAQYFKKSNLNRKIDTGDKYLAQLKGFKGYDNTKKNYRAHSQQYMQALEEMFQDDDVKFISFEKFIYLVLPYILQAGRKRPFTLPAYVKSHYCSAKNSGLVIEISDLDPSNDEAKIELFYNSKNWEFFLNACATFGFMVDKNIPWRLVADVGSPQMLKYAEKYGIMETDQIIATAYEKASSIYFANFKRQLFEAYNRLKTPQYFEMTDVRPYESTRTITRTPIEYSQEEFFSIFGDSYFVNLYCRIRFAEEESDYSIEKQEKIIDNTIELCKTNLEKGLTSFEILLNKPFDYIGSLTYISNRIEQIEKDPRPDDTPDVQTITEPIEEFIDDDGAMEEI
tara:strand:+ start:7147 stop:8433 length:1287 start_codon:yes stop_codon:yes gene_type:complete